jgi:hypothetical protein
VKNLKWAVAIGAVLVVAVAAGTAAATSALVATPTYPAACKKVAPCVDNHLNNLNARLRNQHLQIVALQDQVAAMSSQLGCYGSVRVAQYPHGIGTSTGDTAPGSGGTWLDLMRSDNPANNTVYPFVVNWCAQ